MPRFRSGSKAKPGDQEAELEPTPSPDATAFVPTSVVLQRLHDEASPDYVTLGWLLGRLHQRAFGIILLLLAVVAMAPGISVIASLLLIIPAFQMIAGQPAPVFPRNIAARPLPTRHLAALVQRAVPVLRYIETMIHPRWPTRLNTTKRVVGMVVLLLNIPMLLMPIPLSNVIPALVIALIALAYLEQDGLLLSLALLAAAIALAAMSAMLWATFLGVRWIGGLG